jgi:hypothetical protein
MSHPILVLANATVGVWMLHLYSQVKLSIGGFSMKQQNVCFYLIIFLMLSSGVVLALENNISGNGRIAGMGFAQVANSSGFFSNPANFDEARITLNMVNSELFETGVIYSHFETGFKLLHSLQLNFGFESVADHDLYDNSGYGQKLLAIGVTSKLHSIWKVGASFSQSSYMLFDDVSGNGYAMNLGLCYGPLHIRKAKLNIGVKLDNLLAQRTYKSERKETPQTLFSLGVQLRTDTLIYAVDLLSEEYRFGFEYQVIPPLALRAGWDNKQLTLGIGVLRGPIRIDYAYWLAEVGPTHRIGTSLSF